MAVIDEEGRGWIHDPKSGGVVEFGSPRSMAVRAEEYEELAAKLGKEVRLERVTNIKSGVALRAAREIAALFRKAERGK